MAYMGKLKKERNVYIVSTFPPNSVRGYFSSMRRAEKDAAKYMFETQELFELLTDDGDEKFWGSPEDPKYGEEHRFHVTITTEKIK